MTYTVGKSGGLFVVCREWSALQPCLAAEAVIMWLLVVCAQSTSNVLQNAARL